MKKTLGEMLEGMKVIATKDCNGVEKGKIYTIKADSCSEPCIEGCTCSATFIPIDFEIKKAKHKHTFITKCECGEEIKKEGK